MTQTRIFLFNGGFAGDLVTALYNPKTFLGMENHKVRLRPEVTRLKELSFRQSKNYEQKCLYLKSISDYGVCSSHDIELSLRLRDQTTVIMCSNDKLAKFFFDRLTRDKPDNKSKLNELLEWQKKSASVFKNIIDIAKVNDENFLEYLKIDNNESSVILNQWRENNEIL